MKMTHMTILACFLSIVTAQNFTFQGSGASGNLTVDTWQIGYGAQQIHGVGGNDMEMFTSMLALVVLAAGFAYLHSKSQNKVWASIWLALMFVMAEAAIMGMQIQANADGDAQTAGIMMALFAIIFWILAVIMIIFSVNLVGSFLKLMQEAANGKRK